MERKMKTVKWIKKGIAVLMLFCLLAEIKMQPAADAYAADAPSAATDTYKVRVLTAQRGKKKIYITGTYCLCMGMRMAFAAGRFP